MSYQSFLESPLGKALRDAVAGMRVISSAAQASSFVTWPIHR